MPHDIPHVAQQIANLIRDNPGVAEIWANVLGTAEEPPAGSNRSAHLLDLDLKCFRATLKFAISRHAKRHLRAEAIGIESRPDSRQWIADKANNYLQHPNWISAGLLPEGFPPYWIASVPTLSSPTEGARHI